MMHDDSRASCLGLFATGKPSQKWTLTLAFGSPRSDDYLPESQTELHVKALMGDVVKKIKNDPLGHEQLAEFIREQPVEKLITLSTGERYIMSGSRKHRPKYQVNKHKTLKEIVGRFTKLFRFRSI